MSELLRTDSKHLDSNESGLYELKHDCEHICNPLYFDVEIQLGGEKRSALCDGYLREHNVNPTDIGSIIALYYSSPWTKYKLSVHCNDRHGQKYQSQMRVPQHYARLILFHTFVPNTNFDTKTMNSQKRYYYPKNPYNNFEIKFVKNKCKRTFRRKQYRIQFGVVGIKPNKRVRFENSSKISDKNRNNNNNNNNKTPALKKTDKAHLNDFFSVFENVVHDYSDLTFDSLHDIIHDFGMNISINAYYLRFTYANSIYKCEFFVPKHILGIDNVMVLYQSNKFDDRYCLNINDSINIKFDQTLKSKQISFFKNNSIQVNCNNANTTENNRVIEWNSCPQRKPIVTAFNNNSIKLDSTFDYLVGFASHGCDCVKSGGFEFEASAYSE